MISAMDLPQPAQNMSEALMRVWQNGHTTTVAACCEAAFWRSISSSCAWRDARSASIWAMPSKSCSRPVRNAGSSFVTS